MNNINWDLAPEGAVELRELKSGVCLRWFNKQGEYFSGSGWELSTSDYNVIAIRPTQTKTVADAVEVFGTKWPSSRYNFAWWDSDTEQMLLGCNETSDTVCTRADFEAYVNASKIGKILESSDEKEGEKWTHTYDGQKVRWLGDKPDSCEEMAIQYQSGEYGLARVSALKPIKPTIKPSAAWSLVSKQGWPIHQVTETYDVEEVLAND